METTKVITNSLNSTTKNKEDGPISKDDIEECPPVKVSKVITKNGIMHFDTVAKTYKDLLPYATESKSTDDFIENMVDILKDYIHKMQNRETKIVEFKTPEELDALIDLQLYQDATNLEDLLSLTKEVLKYCVKTGHPRFFNQLFQGLDITSLMGSWITSTVNCSMYTFEVAPVFVIIEAHVLNAMKKYVGFPNGDGIFFPGGSISNMQSMSIARFKACPSIKEEGLSGLPKFVVFSSEEAHYSCLKAAATLGLGTKNVKKIKTDKTGKMLSHDLERSIQECLAKGEKPFYVCATAGTTVAGAFDPLEEIADICKRFNIWMHVDAAWGGSVLVSQRYKHLAKGIDRADSVTWNPHKMLGTILQCSALLVKESGVLQECNKSNASYLFQKDKVSYNVEWDNGDKTIQCGRPADVFKFWMMWKAKGTKGLEEHVDKAFHIARYLTEKIKEHPHFELILEPEYTNVCFRYLPPSIRDMPPGKEREEKLHKIPPEIKRRMTIKGSLLIGFQPLKQHVNFFRMIVFNPALTEKDMDFVLEEIERLGSDL